MHLHSPIWTLIEEADPLPLQAAASAGSSDVHFWSHALHPVTQSTPLQLIVPRVAQYGVAVPSLNDFLVTTRWMIERGADPHAVAPATCTGAVSLRFQAKESVVEVSHAHMSALTLAVAVRSEMRESQLNRIRPQDYDWTQAMEALTKLIEVFCTVTRPVAERLFVDSSVVKMWERVASNSEMHDVQILVGSSTVTAPFAVLSAVSPVLKRMFGSSWHRQGEMITIDLPDTTLSALRLFIDLACTGSSSDNAPTETALATLELAHRWQSDGVVMMLERELCRVICETSFEPIATHAIRFELSILKTACRQFASASQQIKSKVDHGLLPPDVVAMVKGTDERRERENRRRVF